ncbi:MAG: pyridoxal phosphate-dependent aminotransferase [Chloroflexota bacterium]
MKPLATGPCETAHSGIREVVNVALTMPDVIRLEVGQPDFDTPAHIVEATVRAVREGATKYTATAGMLSLRELLVQKLATVNGIVAEPSQINVTIGGVGGIAAALLALLEEGDEVLAPDPAWPNYRLALSYSPARVVTYPLHAAQDFAPDPEELARLITPRTKLLLINSPCNPTGAVFARRAVEQIVELCQRHDLYLLSDECYDEIVFEGEHVSPASFWDEGHVISVFTFSKTYAMTGYRVGYVVTNPELADVINKILEANMSCATSFAQKGAQAALTGPREPVIEMLRAYKRRRDVVDAMLREYGLWTSTPRGAFYAMADVSRSGMDSRTFAFELLREARVAVAPGTAFGEMARDYVRISLASSENDLRQGIQRMQQYIERLVTGG